MNPQDRLRQTLVNLDGPVVEPPASDALVPTTPPAPPAVEPASPALVVPREGVCLGLASLCVQEAITASIHQMVGLPSGWASLVGVAGVVVITGPLWRRYWAASRPWRQQAWATWRARKG
jgi:hypothetical protein